MPCEPPEDIMTHHGNWTIGLQNKVALLRRVRELVQQHRRDER